jgi:2',3'-cyclic-nucleotide 2'-phosphodiesterase (5'-nucleotidase family)
MAELVILHTADRAARLRAMKGEMGALLLDSGDALPVPNILAVPWGAAVARQMGEAGYDAMAVGNREYFLRSWGLGWAAGSFGFPVVATNLDLPPGVPVTRQVLLEHPAGTVAVLGLARCMIRPSSRLQMMSDVRWRDPGETLAEAVPAARSRAEWVVVLSHLGLVEDLRLAAAGLPIDAILGGHDHVLAPLARLEPAKPVVHSGCRARWVSVIRLGREQAASEAGAGPAAMKVSVEAIRL